MSEDRKKYESLKDKAKKAERVTVPIFFACFALLAVSALLTEKLGKAVLLVSIGIFLLFSSCFIANLILLNKKLKKLKNSSER